MASQKKMRRFYFVLCSLFRTSELSLEGTHVRKCSNKFGISLTYSYLCAEYERKGYNRKGRRSCG